MKVYNSIEIINYVCIPKQLFKSAYTAESKVVYVTRFIELRAPAFSMCLALST